MANQNVHDVNGHPDAEPEEMSESFHCCICLDLLYKPIVLPCGHVSCFWCVHRSMSDFPRSKCPICRHTYNHFPSICQMLHHLLLKMYPIAYKMREKEILVEEKRTGYFSPQLGSHACKPLVDNVFDILSDSMNSSTAVCKSTSKRGSNENMESLASVSLVLNNGKTVPKQTSPEAVGGIENYLPANKLHKYGKQISIADALCTACKQLLIHPVVLNCGHVYCASCITRPSDEQYRCELCKCLNPNGFPKVCLELDHFLEEIFCKEYALRNEAVKLKEVQWKHESVITCSKEAVKVGHISSSLLTGDHLSYLSDPRSKFHIGVGCDSCGIYPIYGDRYRCKDCLEAIGFDLCGDCYNTRSKLPGRFNQRHTPEHRMELVKSNIFCDMMLRLVTGRLEDGSTALVLTDDSFENGSPVTLPIDAQESTSTVLTTTITDSDHLMIDRDDRESTS